MPEKFKSFRKMFEGGGLIGILLLVLPRLLDNKPSTAFAVVLCAAFVAYFLRCISNLVHGDVFEQQPAFPEFAIEAATQLLFISLIVMAAWSSQRTYWMMALLMFIQAINMIKLFKENENPGLFSAEMGSLPALKFHYFYLVTACFRLFVAIVLILYFFIEILWGVEALYTNAVFVLLGVPMAEGMECIFRALYHNVND